MSFTEMLGMGMTIRLLDVFSAPAAAVKGAARDLEHSILNTQNAINAGWKQTAAGGGMMLIGGGILTMLAHLGIEASKRASQMDLFNRQIRLLAVNSGETKEAGDGLFAALKKFGTEAPFTLPQVMEGSKVLQSFGFHTDQVIGRLKQAGDWASIFNEKIEKTSELLGRTLTGGFGRAMVYMQGKGVNRKDLAAEAKQMGFLKDLFTDERGSKVKQGYDGEKMVAVLTSLLEKKFGGKMAEYMKTIPGRMSNLVDRGILALDTIGQRLNGHVLAIMARIQALLDHPGFDKFMKSVGDGLLWLMKAAGVVLSPLTLLVSTLIRASDQNPALAKWMTILVGLAGAFLLLGGAIILVAGLQKLWVALGAQSAIAALKTQLFSLIGPMAMVAALASVLYIAWANNFGGIQDTVTRWWGNILTVFSAVYQLMSSMADGVGYMSEATFNALEQRGLTGLAISLFMAFYRVYQVATGVVGAIKDFGSAVAWVVGMVWNLLYPVRWLVSTIAELTGNLYWVAGATNVGVWKAFGYALGVVVNWLILSAVWSKASALWTGISTFLTAARTAGLWATVAATRAGVAATWLWQGAMWAFNAAAAANPIGLICLGIVALIALIVVVVKKWDTLKAKALSMPGWAVAILYAFAPIIGIPILIMRNWDKIKEVMYKVWDSAPMRVFRQTFSDLRTEFWKTWGALKAAWSTLMDALKPVWQAMVSAAKELWDAVRPAFMKFWEAIQPFIKAAGKGVLITAIVLMVAPLILVMGVLYVIAKVLTWVLQLVGWVARKFTDWKAGIIEIGEYLGDYLMEPVRNFTQAWLMVSGFFVAVTNGIKHAWTDAMNWLHDHTVGTVSRLLKYLQNVMNSPQGKVFAALLLGPVAGPALLAGGAIKDYVNRPPVQTQAPAGLTKEQKEALVVQAQKAKGQALINKYADAMNPNAPGLESFLSKRPIQVHTKLELDGRVIGTAVTTHQQEEHADGNIF